MRLAVALPLAVFVLVAAARPAHADPIQLGTWYWFQWSGTGFVYSGTLTTSSPGVEPPGAFAQAPGAVPWTISTGGTGAILTVLDSGAPGDRFSVFDFGTSLGLTTLVPPDSSLGSVGFDPMVALANENLSRGFFPLAANTDHSFEIAVVNNPWGVGGGWLRVDPVCSEFPGGGETGGCFPGPHPFVPDPASSLLLLGTSLAGLAAFARYQRR
jgi:hypothetical protein